MMENCIFCQIAKKQSPANLEYEDKEIVAFWDTNPKTAVHILIVPKKHIPSVTELKAEDEVLMGKMIMVAKKIAEEKGIAEGGYRLCINAGKHSGQVVDHIHLHLMGGQKLDAMV